MNPYWRETISFISGAFLGAGAMLWLMVEVYEGQPKPQPVVIDRLVPREPANIEEQIKELNAKVEAHYIQQMTRQKEVRFKTEKLELAKQVHDTQLVTAQDGADHIRQMAAELGITKMKVTP